MNANKFLGLLLLIPYMSWILIGIGGFITNNPPVSNWIEINNLESVLTPFFFFFIGVIFWGIPYTILAITLAILGKKWQTRKVLLVFACSPLLLVLLVCIELLLFQVFNITSAEPMISTDLFGALTILAASSLIYGYAFVGIGYLLYYIAKIFNWISAN